MKHILFGLLQKRQETNHTIKLLRFGWFKHFFILDNVVHYFQNCVMYLRRLICFECVPSEKSHFISKQELPLGFMHWIYPKGLD